MQRRSKMKIKERLYRAQSGICANSLCNRPLSIRTPLLPNSAELDHVQAKSREGKDEDSNYQLLCRECNGRKSNKDSDVFNQLFAEQSGMLYLKKS